MTMKIDKSIKEKPQATDDLAQRPTMHKAKYWSSFTADLTDYADTRQEITRLRQTVAFLNNMIFSGDPHSDVSLKMVAEALQGEKKRSNDSQTKGDAI
jgi:hypothetical protein